MGFFNLEIVKLLFQTILFLASIYTLSSCSASDESVGDIFIESPTIDVLVAVNERSISLIDSIGFDDTLMFFVEIKSPAGFASYTVDFKIEEGEYQNLQDLNPTELGLESDEISITDESTFTVEEYMKGKTLHFHYEVRDLIGQTAVKDLMIPVSNSED